MSSAAREARYSWCAERAGLLTLQDSRADLKRAKQAYPGGVFFVRFADGTPPIDLARLLREFEPMSHPDEHLRYHCDQKTAAGQALRVGFFASGSRSSSHTVG